LHLILITQPNALFREAFMTSYARVQEILNQAVNNEEIGAHGAFWREVSRDVFVAKVIFGRKLISVDANGGFKADESNLVKALEGRAPFGNDLDPAPAGAIYPRMPADFPPVPAAAIQEIRDWITAGCPE
jgi:hypothetical protein